MPSFVYTFSGGGLTVERLGSNVRIATTTEDTFGNTTVRTKIVSGAEWATAVAAVSIDGETPAAIQQAKRVHDGV